MTPRTLARWAALAWLPVLVGCPAKAPVENVAKPAAPVKPKPFDRATLPDVRFVEITKEAGLDFKHENAARGEKLLPETMGSGAAFFDADGDGDADLFLVNSTRWERDAAAGDAGTKPTHAFYRNDGKGHFADATAESGLAQSMFGMGVAVGDYDNDGDPDLYVTGLGGNALFRNDGTGRFEDVTDAANARGGTGWCTSATFFDMDRDGDLDLFACGYVDWSRLADESMNNFLVGAGGPKAYDAPASFRGSHCLLLRNDAGKFADVSADSGIRVVNLLDGQASVPVAKAMGVAPYDVDGDGLVDLAVANDTAYNFFFHNRGGGKFDQLSLSNGIAFDQGGTVRAAMGIDYADFKNDGTLGLAIGNFANEMTALYVAEDPKSLQFTDLANVYGLGAPTQPPLKFGLFFFDYDLDGRMDLLTTNGHLESDIGLTQASETYAQASQLFWNSGRPGRDLFQLVDASKAGPDLFKPIVGRGSSYADVDGDGDLDVLLTANGGTPHLFRNDGGNANGWLRLDLHGAGGNRDAQGARVEVTAGGVTNRRQLFTTKGYLSSVEHPLTFGLGKQARAERVAITWPSGRRVELTDVAGNRTLRLVEGEDLSPK